MDTFSRNLRDHSALIHARIEEHPFVQALFQGDIRREVYGTYLLGLHEIAQALEQALLRSDRDPALQQLHLEAYFRREAIAQDLRHFPTAQPLRPALAAYLNDEPDAATLIAAVYVRYMADLGGGLMLRPRLQEFWKLQEGPDQGLNLYRYDEDPNQLRRALREQLNQVNLSVHEENACMEQVLRIFQLHWEWFDQLWEL